MAVPVIRANGPQSTYVVSPASLGILVTVVSGAPTAWEWQVIRTPLGLQDTRGTNGDFVDGLATVQNPTMYLALPGGYLFRVRAWNASDGWSIPIQVEMASLQSDTSQTAADADAGLTLAGAHAARHTNGADQVANATPVLAGLMTAADKAKLDAMVTADLVVADLAALAALDASPYSAGQRVFVVSVNDEYTLTAGAYVPDALEVIAAFGTVMYWIADLVGRWDDVQGDVSQGTANAALTYEVFRDTAFSMYFFRHDQNDSLSMRFQFPHGVLTAGTTVVPHIHVVPMVAPAAPPVNVRFTGAYAWALDGVAVPAAVGWTAFGPVLQQIVAADAWKEKLVVLANIAVPVGFKGSSILLVNVVRTGTDGGDTYDTNKATPPGTAAANLGLLSLDVHYRKATQGSVTITP